MRGTQPPSTPRRTSTIRTRVFGLEAYLQPGMPQGSSQLTRSRVPQAPAMQRFLEFFVQFSERLGVSVVHQPQSRSESLPNGACGHSGVPDESQIFVRVPPILIRNAVAVLTSVVLVSPVGSILDSMKSAALANDSRRPTKIAVLISVMTSLGRCDCRNAISTAFRASYTESMKWSYFVGQYLLNVAEESAPDCVEHGYLLFALSEQFHQLLVAIKSTGNGTARSNSR